MFPSAYTVEKRIVSGAINQYQTDNNITQFDDFSTNSNITLKAVEVGKASSDSGFFSINKEPTSSKDPYALRRAGLGIIRIILKEKFSFDLCLLLEKSLTKYYNTKILKLEKNKEIREQVIEKIKKFFHERL